MCVKFLMMSEKAKLQTLKIEFESISSYWKSFLKRRTFWLKIEDK